MIKTKTFIEVEVKGRDYAFLCSPDAPLPEAYEALKLVEQYLVDRLKAIQPEESLKEKTEEPNVN